MKTWGRRLSGAGRAFTIIEALIAIVLVVAGVLGLLAVVPVTMADTMRDSQRMQAVAAGQQYLDAIRHYVAQSGTLTGIPAAPTTIAVDAGDSNQSSVGNTIQLASPGTFVLTSNCAAASGSISGKEWDCVVTVTWTAGTVTRSVNVESYIVAQK